MPWTQSSKRISAECTKGTLEILPVGVVYPAPDSDNLTQQSLNRSVRQDAEECM
jgi:hypothetical protein